MTTKRNIYKDAEHPFAQYIRIIGKGKTGARSLTYDEAYQAFSMILKNEVLDVQLGAFLMLLRVKEESVDELAGFVQATRDQLNFKALDVDLTGHLMLASASIIHGLSCLLSPWPSMAIILSCMVQLGIL